MSISVICVCGKHFETPDKFAGRRARCPVCGHEMILPAPQPAAAVVFIEDQPEPTRTSRKAIASFVLGLHFIFTCFTGIPAILLGISALGDIGRSQGRLRGKALAIAGIVLGAIDCLLMMFPAYHHDYAPARRAQCMNNLKQIALAMHVYHEANGCLPPAAITDKDGRPLLSWRVAILPYLEAGELYAKFHLDEPWYSPHNLTLIDEMPTVYACPSVPYGNPRRGLTGYLAVVDASTCFTPDFTPVRFTDIPDGSSNTLLVGESRPPVPWTKPEDLTLDTTRPLYGFGSHHPKGFNVALADGTVRFFKNTITLPRLHEILTRNGSEAVSGSY